MDGEALAHRERAEFKKIGKNWRYVDGHMVSGAPIKKKRKLAATSRVPVAPAKNTRSVAADSHCIKLTKRAALQMEGSPFVIIIH